MYGKHLAIVIAHLGSVGSRVAVAEVNILVRIVTGTSNTSRPTDECRPITVPWMHGLLLLNKQTASFPIRLVAQAVTLAAITCILVQGKQFAAVVAR